MIFFTPNSHCRVLQCIVGYCRLLDAWANVQGQNAMQFNGFNKLEAIILDKILPTDGQLSCFAAFFIGRLN